MSHYQHSLPYSTSLPGPMTDQARTFRSDGHEKKSLSNMATRFDFISCLNQVCLSIWAGTTCENKKCEKWHRPELEGHCVYALNNFPCDIPNHHEKAKHLRFDMIHGTFFSDHPVNDWPDCLPTLVFFWIFLLILCCLLGSWSSTLQRSLTDDGVHGRTVPNNSGTKWTKRRAHPWGAALQRFESIWSSWTCFWISIVFCTAKIKAFMFSSRNSLCFLSFFCFTW